MTKHAAPPHEDDMLENRDLSGVGTWLSVHAPTIYAVLMSIIIAFLRIAYGHTNGTAVRTKAQTIIECALCGALTLTLTSGLDLLGLQQTASTMIGGSVGFLGVEKIRMLADKFLDSKVNKVS